MIVDVKENKTKKKTLAARLDRTMVSKSLTGSTRAIKNAVNIPTSNRLNIGVSYYVPGCANNSSKVLPRVIQLGKVLTRRLCTAKRLT